MTDTDMGDVLEWLQGKKEEVEDPEALNCYELAEEHLNYGLQAEYLEKESSQYEDDF